MQNGTKSSRFDDNTRDFLLLPILYENYGRILLKTRIRNLIVHGSDLL